SSNWGKGKALLELIDAGLKEGLDLSLDAYPYIAGYTQLFQIFPINVWGVGGEQMLKNFSDPAYRAGVIEKMNSGIYDGLKAANGGASGVQIIQCPDPAFDQKTLLEISKMLDVDPVEAAIQMMERFGSNVMMFYFLQNMDEL
ncbi:Collagen-like protein, partial [Dysosmobacter welbionis]